jgi:alkylation response protein AidB-like acyl-CoA dehydrogenase
MKESAAFGKLLIDFQNVRFKLAECKTAAHIASIFIDNCIERFLAGQLDAVPAAKAKYWLTDSECRIVNECVQSCTAVTAIWRSIQSSACGLTAAWNASMRAPMKSVMVGRYE